MSPQYNYQNYNVMCVACCGYRMTFCWSNFFVQISTVDDCLFDRLRPNAISDFRRPWIIVREEISTNAAISRSAKIRRSLAGRSVPINNSINRTMMHRAALLLSCTSCLCYVTALANYRSTTLNWRIDAVCRHFPRNITTLPINTSATRPWCTWCRLGTVGAR